MLVGSLFYCMSRASLARLRLASEGERQGVRSAKAASEELGAEHVVRSLAT